MASKTELTLKINVIAKDLDIKSKDIVDALTQSGVPDKKTTGNIDASEFSILFYKLTGDNQIKNMEDYIAGKADIKREPRKVVEKPEEPPKETQPSEPVKETKAPDNAAQTPVSTDKKPQQEKKPVQNKPVVKTSFAHTSERGASKSAERFSRPLQQPQKKKEDNKNEKQDNRQQKNYNVANMRGGGEVSDKDARAICQQISCSRFAPPNHRP